ncbi:PHB depolymerase family esterase [uncultured Nevskia sp.]|uniref:alpha/beta hydrolase family esterase n=1 Tax=uncultured Nevskia sp. TaxID=228950 RepID=UPI0025D80058|nr:PHB depolymerase family esterase [uncultured Nevskia sp.]
MSINLRPSAMRRRVFLAVASLLACCTMTATEAMAQESSPPAPIVALPILGPLLPMLPGLPIFADLGQFFGGLDLLLLQAGGERIEPTDGTETFEGTYVQDGLTRRYVGVRPIGAPAGAPVLLLLHPLALKPARMANLTRAGRLAAQYGAWVYLPESFGANWNDDPSRLGVDDVGFLSGLISREQAANGLDAGRTYVAGYSNGGFMAERLACERPQQFAGLAMVAATLRNSLATRCMGGQRMPTVIFAGTSDAVVPYTGMLGQYSVPDAAAFWSVKNGCSAGFTDTRLPNTVLTDGTTVTLRRYRSCADSDVRLYTVNGGGHTWPGTNYAGYTIALGATTFDIDATLLLWQVLVPFARP